MARSRSRRTPLTDAEREDIVLAVKSVFRKPKNLYSKIVPYFPAYGFTPSTASADTVRRQSPFRSNAGRVVVVTEFSPFTAVWGGFGDPDGKIGIGMA
jgi:hypothetical protein